MPRVRLQKLFGGDHAATDHRWFRTLKLGRTPLARGWRRFCALAYDRFERVLDDDFPSRFRVETPNRFSELFFATALENAGWEPIHRVTGFDLAFSVPSGGRLLVEVTTPAPQPKDSWHEEQRGPVTVVSGDGRSKDAALLRLTSAFAAKAEIVANALRKGHALADDYKVIAISGLRISQEARIPLHAAGNPPEFARAFLPLGDLVTRTTLNRETGELEMGPLHHRFSDQIEKPSGNTIPRTAFVSGEFAHVDAVAYSEVGLDELDRAHLQVSVLHNPTSSNSKHPILLRMAREFVGEIDGDRLHLQPHRLPEIASREDAIHAAERQAFEELFGARDPKGSKQ